MGKVKSRFNMLNLKKTIRYFKKNGLYEVYHTAREQLAKKSQETYTYQGISEETAKKQRSESFQKPCKISVIVPAYETKEEYLWEMITSVINQTYSNWELIIADASSSNAVFDVMGRFQDDRIHYVRLNENLGISENTNQALSKATGDYIGLLDHDDTLTMDALYEVSCIIDKDSPQMIYSDEDKMDGSGTMFFEPHFKLDFNLDLLLSNNYICHFLVISSKVIKELGFRKQYDGAQDYDLVLRAVSKIPYNQISHLPKVLYHWRCHEDSTAANPASKSYAYEAGLRAVQDYLLCHKIKASVSHCKHLGFYQVFYEESIFCQRKDVGAIGGKVVKKGKIIGGAMTQEGKVIYAGLDKHFSGYMNRAILLQDVNALDISCIILRKELQPIYIEVKKVIDKEYETFSKEKKKLAMSLEISKRVKELGYVLVYDPSMEVIANE